MQAVAKAVLAGAVAGGAALAVRGGGWLVVFLGIEMNLVGFAPLLVAARSAAGRVEAGVKYFLAQAVGSVVVLWGVVAMHLGVLGQLGAVVVVAGLLVKIGGVPMHWWFPSVMREATWARAAVLCTWQKVAPVGLLCGVRGSVRGGAVVAAGVASAGVGTLGGINQTRLRVLVGYSSVAHVGWVTRVAGVAGDLGLGYLAAYSAVVLPVVWGFSRAEGAGGVGMEGRGVWWPRERATVGLALLRLAGLPPLRGFVAKALALVVLVPNNPGVAAMLVVVRVVGVAYYLGVVFSLLYLGGGGALSAKTAGWPAVVAGGGWLPLAVWLAW